jgi:hypothetical protein
VGGDGIVLAALIGQPLDLPSTLVARFPELATVRWRRGGLPVALAGVFMGRSSIAGITLWRTVFLATNAPLDPQLLLHELRHVHQFETSLAFPLLYLWESLRHGYRRNRYEADARAYAAERLRQS